MMNFAKTHSRELLARSLNAAVTAGAAIAASAFAMKAFDDALMSGEFVRLDALWGAAWIVGGMTTARALAALVGWMILASGSRVLVALSVEVAVIVIAAIITGAIGIGITGASWPTLLFAGLAGLGFVVQDAIMHTPPRRKRVR